MSLLEFIQNNPVWSMMALIVICLTVAGSAQALSIALAAIAQRNKD